MKRACFWTVVNLDFELHLNWELTYILVSNTRPVDQRYHREAPQLAGLSHQG